MGDGLEGLKQRLKRAERVAVLTKINLEATPHSHFMDFTLQGKAGEIFPTLVEDW